MIKTVSFALPRPASGTPSKSSPKAGRARPKSLPLPPAPAPSLAMSFPKPAPLAPISASQAREQLQRSAPTARPLASPSPPLATASTSPAKRAPHRTAAPAEPSPGLFDEAPAPEPKAKAAPVATPVPLQASEAALPKTAAPAKKRRVKIPENLAEQYGQSLSKRVESGAVIPVPEEETPKKRMNRAERQARRELMNPDDDLRARLERAHNAVPQARKEKRPQGWRFDCGRCGQTSFFQTKGALCSCGALAIKD